MSEAAKNPRYEVVRKVRCAERWCFGCRKLLAGTNTLYADTTGTREGFWSYACDGCGEDRSLMFGPE